MYSGIAYFSNSISYSNFFGSLYNVTISNYIFSITYNETTTTRIICKFKLFEMRNNFIFFISINFIFFILKIMEIFWKIWKFSKKHRNFIQDQLAQNPGVQIVLPGVQKNTA